MNEILKLVGIGLAIIVAALFVLPMSGVGLLGSSSGMITFFAIPAIVGYSLVYYYYTKRTALAVEYGVVSHAAWFAAVYTMARILPNVFGIHESVLFPGNYTTIHLINLGIGVIGYWGLLIIAFVVQWLLLKYVPRYGGSVARYGNKFITTSIVAATIASFIVLSFVAYIATAMWGG